MEEELPERKEKCLTHSRPEPDGPPKKKRKTKKKKKPTPIREKISSRQESKKIIDSYHSYVHQLDQLERKKLDSSQEANQEIETEITAIKQKMEKMGGIRKYQDASVFDYTYRKYRPDRWVLEKLVEHKIKPEAPAKLKLLDVGSLSNFFRECNWVDEMAIDISPRDPSVIQMDFFEMDSVKYNNAFDVVVLSLVLNFIGDSLKRGNMLLGCYPLLKDKGYLFIMVPISCINNSRHMNHMMFLEILKEIGFYQFPEAESECVPQATSAKLAFYIFQKRQKKTTPGTSDDYSGKDFPLVTIDHKPSAVDFGIEIRNKHKPKYKTHNV